MNGSDVLEVEENSLKLWCFEHYWMSNKIFFKAKTITSRLVHVIFIIIPSYFLTKYMYLYRHTEETFPHFLNWLNDNDKSDWLVVVVIFPIFCYATLELLYVKRIRIMYWHLIMSGICNITLYNTYPCTNVSLRVG